ncbi:amino acid/polyamine transporter I [Mycena metata]|uniref:Amino acid/polyamine transporter I n=1 Tax=Mycena metata TaxID=1033252 RepID=A0AAD7IYB9_9AGAR|nr:amino acid/polyamine transporter I [Mycena metata]
MVPIGKTDTITAVEGKESAIETTSREKRDALTDDDLLARLGYKQEFKREFSKMQLFGLSFTIMGVVQSIAAVLFFSIPYGGPVGMVWGWFTCCCFLIIVGLAMAELGSAAPTAGGLWNNLSFDNLSINSGVFSYYWTFTFSSPKYRRLLSWLIGYVNTAAYVAGMAGADWATATQIMASVNIGTDGEFVATTAQTYGVYCALLAMHTVMACMATKTIARLQYFYVFLNIALFLVVIIALPVATPKELHNSGSFAFGHFQNTSGWTNRWAFVMSFLAPAWTVGGYDTVVHISEEARNAPRAVPFAIMSATILSALLGWIVIIVLALYMGSDLDSVIGNPIGQPMATIFFNSVGKTGTLVIWWFIIITLWISGMDFLIAGSRQVFAFSRDRGIPLSGWLYNINPKTKTPVHAVIFLAIMALLLGLLAFAGPLAISAVFTMLLVCQYIAFVTPITARWVGGQKFVPGPFNLGLMSAPISFVASAYLIFMIFVFLFPPVPSPTSHSMNYTVVVVGGTLLLSLGYYFFPRYGGRYWFTGPVETIRRVGQVSNDRDEKDSGISRN